MKLINITLSFYYFFLLSFLFYITFSLLHTFLSFLHWFSIPLSMSFGFKFSFLFFSFQGLFLSSLILSSFIPLIYYFSFFNISFSKRSLVHCQATLITYLVRLSVRQRGVHFPHAPGARPFGTERGAWKVSSISSCRQLIQRHRW